jgi:hypothetical protein
MLETTIKNEMDYINTEILRKLLSSTSKSQNKKCTIQISDKLWNSLVKTYKIKPNSNQWIDGENVLNDFSFEVERFFNSSDYCCIKRNSFKIRLFQRYLKYFDQNRVLKKKPFKHSLTFKFQCLSLKK